jgi:CRISPR/Cas system-associated endoribonuclease Cas2
LLAVLRQRLTRLIQAEFDSVRLWPVPDASCARIVHLGKAVHSTDWDDPVI